MKKIVISIFLLASFFCFAKEISQKFPQSATLLEISQATDIPVKKIAEYLELENQTKFNITLAELNISPEQLQKAVENYQENKNSFYGGIALVGMSIVFLSLILVGACIACLQYLDHKKKPKLKTVQTSVGKISALPEHLSSNAIVAAITAMYLHEAEVEEKNRLILTWKRSRLSMWSASNILENRFFDIKRGK